MKIAVGHDTFYKYSCSDKSYDIRYVLLNNEIFAKSVMYVISKCILVCGMNSIETFSWNTKPMISHRMHLKRMFII